MFWFVSDAVLAVFFSVVTTAYLWRYGARHRYVLLTFGLACVFVSATLTSGPVAVPDWLTRALIFGGVFAMFAGEVLVLRQVGRERRAAAGNQGQTGGEQ